MRGQSEYLPNAKGQLSRLRTYDAGKNKWSYTAQGKRHYETKRTELVLSLPVKIRGTNATTGKTWERKSFLPVTELEGASEILTREGLSPAQREVAVKPYELLDLVNISWVLQTPVTRRHSALVATQLG